MYDSDLDGDTYFICYEPTLRPSSKAMQNPEKFKIQSSNIFSTAKPEFGTGSELSEAIAKAFAQMHGSTLLGSASNEWQRVVEHCPDLGNGEYPKQLAEVVAIALVRFPFL